MNECAYICASSHVDKSIGFLRIGTDAYLEVEDGGSIDGEFERETACGRYGDVGVEEDDALGQVVLALLREVNDPLQEVQLVLDRAQVQAVEVVIADLITKHTQEV